MSSLHEEDILQFALQFYKVIGENIEHTPRKLYLLRIFNILALLSVLFFIIERCFKEDGVMLVKSLESGITIIHILTKYTAFMYGKKGLKSIIDARLKFWDPNQGNKESLFYANNLLVFTKKMQFLLLIVFIISLEFHLLKPFFNKGEAFPLNVWIRYDSLFLHILVLVLQYYCLCLAPSIVMTHDALYLSICVHITIQLRLLRWKVYEAAVGRWEDLRKCIEHQQFLSSIFNQMQDVYSWVVLMQYFMTLGMACVQLYILSTRAVNIADGFELVIYMVTMYCEVGFYSIPIENISVKFTDIGNAVYMSHWYEKDPVRRRNLLTIMTYSQVTKFLKGGGIIPQNMDTFGSVFRKSFSLYLLLKNLLQE